jgi:alanine racemase
MAVIKANGYGHGMVHLAGEAAAAGITDFGVARVHEGLELRTAGFDQRILVFESASPGAVRTAIDHGLTLTITDPISLAVVEEEARRAGRKSDVHVKLDTGMGRLGLPPGEAGRFVLEVARSPHVTLRGIYSHFATSEDPDRTFALLQLERFSAVLDGVRREGVEIPDRHMANSGAIISLPGSHFDMVRPGIMLYGYPPGQDMPERYPVRPVLSLISRVAFVKDVDAGVSISYGRKYFTGAHTTVATVPMGYGDGYSRLLTGKAEVLIRGRRYRVAGTICMDQLMVDVGVDAGIAVGDEVVFIGRSGAEVITAWDVASRIGSIPYETTCALTPRVPRVYESCR